MAGEGKLGDRLRAYRERLELTTETLAEKSGVSAAVIGAVEAGEVYPALSVLLKLSRALGQRLGTFMDDQYRPDPIITRAGERAGARVAHKAGASGGFEYFPLGRGKTDRHMEPFYIEIAEDAPTQVSTHEGEEFVVVVAGEVTLDYGGATERLQAGDSAYYNSVVPHILKAEGGRPASIYAIVFTPF